VPAPNAEDIPDELFDDDPQKSPPSGGLLKLSFGALIT
jgi:hypothetical protein